MKIDSLKSLREEKFRTMQQIEMLEQQIQNDYLEIKEDLNPSHLIKNAVQDFVISNHSGIVGESVRLGVNNLVKNVLFRKSGFLTKTILSFLAGNYAKNFVANKSDDIVDWIAAITHKHNSVSQNGKHYDRSTTGADLDY